MNKKKLLSLILAICMVISLAPTIAFADGSTTSVKIEVRNAQSGNTKYKVGDGDWNELTESKEYTITGIESGDKITLCASPNQDQELDTTGTQFYVDGEKKNIDLTDLQSEAGWNFTCTEGSAYQICVEYRSGGEPGPEPGGEPAHGGYKGVQKTASVTVNGKADFYINDSDMINSEGGTREVDYTYNSEDGTVDFYFNCFINQRITNLKINNTDYYGELPTPNTPEGKAALFAACKGQLNEFKITVPYSDFGYTIESNVKSLDDTDKDYMVVGNFLWNYTDSNQGDDYIDHGRMELQSVSYNGIDYSPDKLTNPNTGFDWGQNENGGNAVLPVGAVVTVKLIPDYGYQLTSFGINDSVFGTGDEQSTFTFYIRPGNAHLGAKFTRVEDKVTSDADIVSEGTIELGEREIDTGSVVLSVDNAPADVNEEAFQEAVEENEGTEEYEIASILDINLKQVIYKGTEDENNVWSNNMTELDNDATVTLTLNEDYTDAVVVHEKHDENYDVTGYEVIDTTYDSEDGTITFETDSFSNYAVAVAPGASSGNLFSVTFDPFGDDENTKGKVQVEIGDGETQYVEPDHNYRYSNGDTPITFTLTPPAEAVDNGYTPGVIVMDGTTYEFKPVLQKNDGKYSFTITPNADFRTADLDFVVWVSWNWDFDTFGPNEDQFMVETNVPAGDEYGTILLQPGANSGNDKSFGNLHKYIYDRNDEKDKKLYVTFIPEPGKKLVAFWIGDEMYGYEDMEGSSEGMYPLPELTVDGKYEATITIPKLSDTAADNNYIYIEAIFEDADPVAVPTGLRWDGKTAKWDAVEGADHYRVTLLRGFSGGNEINWIGMANSGIITDTCKFDFSNAIDSSDDSTKYRFLVCAIKNKVCSEEAASVPYGNTAIHTDYSIIEGANGTWTQNSDRTLTFRANGDFSKFTGVKVDGTLIDAKNYTAVSGSTVITLKADYLKTLSVGKHTLTVVYTDGECSTNFTIIGTTNLTNSTSPQTGDDSNLWLWFAVLCVGIAGILGITVYRKKKM